MEIESMDGPIEMFVMYSNVVMLYINSSFLVRCQKRIGILHLSEAVILFHLYIFERHCIPYFLFISLKYYC